MLIALQVPVSLILLFCLLIAWVPTLPGIPLMFLVTLVYGFVDNFQHLHPIHLAVFAGIMVLSVLIDSFSGVLGAKIGGASRKSLLAGMIGLFVGLLLFPPFGAFAGLFVGVFGMELIQFGDHAKAFKAATSSVTAAVVGTLLNIALAIAYFIAFLIIVF